MKDNRQEPSEEEQSSERAVSGGPVAQGRAASYARRSDPKEEGILQQHETNTTRALADGFDVPVELRWTDDGVTGVATQRGGLNSLLEVIASGRAPFSRLYVRERDRLSRAEDPRFAPYFEYFCKMHGVQVCYALDVQHTAYDGTDPDAMVRYLMSAMQNVQAHQEWRQIRERTTRGTRAALRSGKYVNGGPAPFGYDKWLVCDRTRAFVRKVGDGERVRLSGHHFSVRVNPTERVVVEQIFKGIVAGKTYAQIARELEAAGAPRCGPKAWSLNAVRKVARNPLHMGDYIHGRLRYRGAAIPAAELDPNKPVGRAVVVEGFVDDPVVTAEVWHAAQRVMNARMATDTMRKASTTRFLLTGVIRCATCGDSLYGHRQPERNGGREHMYRHAQSLRTRHTDQPPCPHVNRYIQAAPLEAAALDATHRLLDSDAAERLAREELAKLRRSVGIESYTAALKQAEKDLEGTLRAAKAANLRAAKARSAQEREIHDATMQELATEAEALRARIAGLRAETVRIVEVEGRLPQLRARRIALSDALARGSAEDRKHAVGLAVHSMRVDFAANHVDVRVRAV